MCINRFPFVKIIQDIFISAYFKYKHTVLLTKIITKIILCVYYLVITFQLFSTIYYNISVSNSLISFSIAILVSEGSIMS